MKLKFSILMGLLWLIGLTPAHALPPGSSLVREAVGGCGNPCVIGYNDGGGIERFKMAGDAIRKGARKGLVIDGFCASACMVMADRARPRVCITERATFGYHKTNWGRPIPLRPDLHRWVMRNGGYPSNSSYRMMSNYAARQFWPLCS